MSGVLGLVRNIFHGHGDERSRALMQAAAMLDGLLGEMDVTLRKMEDRYRELARKAEEALNARRRDEYEGFMQEMDEVAKYMSVLQAIKQSVFKVKLRIDTIVNMGGGFENLAVAIRELHAIRQVIEPIVPELTESLVKIERQVSQVLASSSLPDSFAQQRRDGGLAEESAIEDLFPPHMKPSRLNVSARPRAAAAVAEVDMRLVKKWLLHELSVNPVFEIRAFCEKYNVPRPVVLRALRELEEEGYIRLQRPG